MKAQRAHPDLNQGPADLQSAALTTHPTSGLRGWSGANLRFQDGLNSVGELSCGGAWLLGE